MKTIKELTHFDTEDIRIKTLKEVLNMIDENIAYQKKIIKQACGIDAIVNVCECIIIVLNQQKARIEG